MNIALVIISICLGVIVIATGAIGIQCKNEKKMSDSNYQYLVIILTAAVVVTCAGCGMGAFMGKKKYNSR